MRDDDLLRIIGTAVLAGALAILIQEESRTLMPDSAQATTVNSYQAQTLQSASMNPALGNAEEAVVRIGR